MTTQTPATIPATTPASFLEAEAILAESRPGYTSRPAQQRMAEGVEESIVSGRHLLAQAATGVGKSLALLIPAILSGRRTVVSTATKALQAQYLQDLPKLQVVEPFTYAVLRGRSNYVCRNRAALVDDPIAQDILNYLQTNPDIEGLQEDFPFDIPIWSKVCGNSEECEDLHCKDLGGCYIYIARDKAKESQIVVVNHSLLAFDLTLDNSLLGDYGLVIVDEAHSLAEAAISAFGTQVSEASITALQSEVRSLLSTGGGNLPTRLQEASEALSGSSTLFWLSLTSSMPTSISTGDKLRLTPGVVAQAEDEWVNLIRALYAYSLALSNIIPPTEDKPLKRYRLLKRRATSLASRVEALLSDYDTNVRWVEWQTNRRGTKRVVIQSQPIEVGEFLQKTLFTKTVIGASATLKVGGSFDFVANQLGLTDNYTGLDVGTVFDYQKQALVYIPNIPEPAGKTISDWEAIVPSVILGILEASKGRALCLFTSVKQLNRVYDIISTSLPYTVYKQGECSQSELVRKFKEDTHSVLFATKTWFTGIDIQGESLSAVIIDKIPFPSPGDPVVEATCELLDKRYGPWSGFRKYQVPKACELTEQAAGRLVRTHDDTGVVALLDSRALTKNYRKQIIASLPPTTVTSKLADVREFFA